MKSKIKSNDVGYQYIKLDDTAKTALRLLIRCAEEKFEQARVVQKEDIACLTAAQYIKEHIKDE